MISELADSFETRFDPFTPEFNRFQKVCLCFEEKEFRERKRDQTRQSVEQC
jgi:hypothetical protein